MSSRVDQMAELWAKGYYAKEIARMLGISEQTVRWTVTKHRDRFARRRSHLTSEQWDELIARIDAGELTCTQAAREAGASRETVYVKRKERHGRKGDS